MHLPVELFSLRTGERFSVCIPFDPAVHRYGVCLTPVEPLPSPVRNASDVVDIVVIGCERTPDGWQWMQLSPGTKEAIGRVVEGVDGEPSGRWCGLVIVPPEKTEAEVAEIERVCGGDV